MIEVVWVSSVGELGFLRWNGGWIGEDKETAEVAEVAEGERRGFARLAWRVGVG